jgi:thiosulfate dehydrogenase
MLMHELDRRLGGYRLLWPAAIAALALAVIMVDDPNIVAAQGVDDRLYEDKGFYQSYVFGAPDMPSEPWLLAYGGRLYDTWWAVLFQDPPEGNHPGYPARGGRGGSDTWRCVECHGWDYRGRDGRYAQGPHATGIKGVDSMAGAVPAEIAKILRDDTHRYTPKMIPDQALEALALFVSKGQIDSGAVIDPATGVVRGNAARGREIYQNVCAICHDYDGMAWITGDEDGLITLGAIASKDPWRGLHKMMNGQTYADMPAMRVFGLQTVLDVLAYAQSLPVEP